MQYECQNAGCDVGVFEGADEQWFWDKGMDTPRNCPDCRAWKREQEDEVFTCSVCGNKRYISRGVKIMHHKNDGPWKDPEWCIPCERDPDRRLEREARKSAIGKMKRDMFKEGREKWRRAVQVKLDADDVEDAIELRIGSPFTAVIPMEIASDPVTYRGITHHADGTQFDHIMRHLFDLESATSLSGEQSVFGWLGELSAVDDQRAVAEFVQEDQRTIKYDKTTGVVEVIESTGTHVVTAFPPGRGAAYVLDQITSGRWEPLAQEDAEW